MDTSIGSNLDNRKVAVAKFTKRIHNVTFLDDYDLDSTATDAKKLNWIPTFQSIM